MNRPSGTPQDPISPAERPGDGLQSKNSPNVKTSESSELAKPSSVWIFVVLFLLVVSAITIALIVYGIR